MSWLIYQSHKSVYKICEDAWFACDTSLFVLGLHIKLVPYGIENGAI